MATTGIRFNVDTSQAQSQISSLNESLDDLEARLKAAKHAGDFSSAADLTRQIEITRVAGVQSSLPQAPGIGSTGFPVNGESQVARQIDMRLELLNRAILELTNQLEDSTANGRHKDAFNISSTLNNVEEERQRLENERNRIQKGAMGQGNEAVDAIKKYGMVRYLGQGLGYVNQIAGVGFNYRTAMANGDYLGAGINALDSGSNIAQGVGGGLLGAGLMLGATPVGWGLMAAGGLLEVGGAIGKYVAGDKSASKAEAEAYERTLSTSNGLNKLFTNGGTAQSNGAMTSEIMRNARMYAQDTGMATMDLVNLATEFSRYGATSADGAMQQARQIANYANSTGADIGTIQNFLGTARRYGDTSDVLGYASQARQAAGMTKGQTQEFLQSLQSVIEDGIANGYIKSTEDVSKTLTMFARLSDNNPLWQGQQGANRLNQMNSSIASATNLQSTSDVIVASAASDILRGKSLAERNKILGGKSNKATGTYIDSMLLMEQGTNTEMFGQLAKNIQAMEGGNIAGQIERYKSAFGLNYQGAVDVYNMSQKYLRGEMGDSSFQESIQSMKKDVKYQSEETRLQNAVNRLDENVRQIAQSKFWDKLTTLENMAKEGKTTTIKTSDGKVVQDLSPSRKIAVDTEVESVRKILKSKNFERSMTAGRNPYAGGGEVSSFYKSLTDSDVTEKDSLFMKVAAQAAMRGDGVVTDAEIKRYIGEHDKTMQNTYKNGSTETYLSQLVDMFRSLLGDHTFTFVE